jgi:hypothetical protein
VAKHRPPRRWRGLLAAAGDGYVYFSKVRLASNRAVLRRGRNPHPVDMNGDVIHTAVWHGATLKHHSGNDQEQEQDHG